MENFNLDLLLNSRIPFLMEGPPGCGKTALINATCEALDVHCITILASIREPSDFAGLPVITENGVNFSSPGWAIEANHMALKKRVLIFLDELSGATNANQMGALRMIHEGVVGDTRLHHNVFFGAASNPPEYTPAAYELTPPLANRFIHLPFHLQPTKWAEEFPRYWGKPPKYANLREDKWAEARAYVAGYISTRPTTLLKLPEGESNRSKAWASPRTWDMVSRILGVIGINNIESGLPYFVGCIGKDALEFVNWAKLQDLPKPADILKNPLKAEVPIGRSDKTFAILASLISCIKDNLTKENYDNGFVYLGRVCDAKQQDIAAVWAKQLAQSAKSNWPIPPMFMKFSAITNV